ncbi:MAG: arginine--tRNA ligase [Vallitalea sp.]|jgi:arginyl-tRNA synthetase|nr:arginine--tRNA ligase [Vallitalea sp.]
MKTILELISTDVKNAFSKCNYSSQYGNVSLSNRPDLCQFQCNGAMIASKTYKKAPIIIANEVVNVLNKCSHIETVSCVMPGFINITLTDKFIINYLNDISKSNNLGCMQIGSDKTIIIDYGGPNVAKPLHIGHLRSAIIGESIKIMARFLGYNVLGDVHLGDWGLQIGLIMAELERRYPDLVYFNSNYTQDYPCEPPFDITELEEIYPSASNFSKTNSLFLKKAKKVTYDFQNGHRGYRALWKHILNVSIADLKKNYSNLNVYFDLWNKESDIQDYIPDVIKSLKDNGLAYISQGALVVDVKEDRDTREMPPCILVKSDGATLYSTTDISTIAERVETYNPDEIIYVVDKRQELHFEQVFRCAKKGKLVPQHTKLTFLGFGTMNGKDGKPFKTRDGGVMRLENLISQVCDEVYNKIKTNKSISATEAKDISNKVGISALKYGDLSNQIAKDYIFDPERFTSFEGNTGPYIQYTAVRIKSILNKFEETNCSYETNNISLQVPKSNSESNLMLTLTQVNDVITDSFIKYCPNKICQYIYDLSNDFNKFYHENRILTEENSLQQLSWIKLLMITEEVLTTCLDLIGIETPDKM